MKVRGRVNIQAQTIRPTIPHLTADIRLVAPTPIMDVEITCVVLTGMPICEALKMISDAVVSAAKP